MATNPFRTITDRLGITTPPPQKGKRESDPVGAIHELPALDPTQGGPVARGEHDDFASPPPPPLKSPPLRETALVGLTDRYSSYPSVRLTPERMAEIFREADYGSVYHQMELFEEMLEKDLLLSSLFARRKSSVARRKHMVVPAVDDDTHKEHAAAVEELIKNIPDWRGGVKNRLDAVPKGFALIEMWWTNRGGTYSIEKLTWEHQKKVRLGKISDPYSDPREMRLVVDPVNVERFRGLVDDVELSRAVSDGLSIDNNPILRRRFMIPICHARSGLPSRTSILRACAWPWMFKNFDIKWMVSFAERLLGIRIGKYDVTQPEQKDLLASALRQLGSDTSAVITKESEIEFVDWLQKAATHQIYGDIIEWVDTDYSIAVLGHTGSSKSTPGKLGAEEAALEATADIIAEDAEFDDATVNSDMVRPYIDWTFGKPPKGYPKIVTDTTGEPDPLIEVKVDSALQNMGYPITRKYVSEKYQRPLPADDDVILTPAQTTGGGSGLGQGLSQEVGLSTSLQAKKKLLMGE